MIVSITFILIVLIICASVCLIFYWKIFSQDVNVYTLNDVRYIENQIRSDIREIKEKLNQD